MQQQPLAEPPQVLALRAPRLTAVAVALPLAMRHLPELNSR